MGRLLWRKVKNGRVKLQGHIYRPINHPDGPTYKDELDGHVCGFSLYDNGRYTHNGRTQAYFHGTKTHMDQLDLAFNPEAEYYDKSLGYDPQLMEAAGHDLNESDGYIHWECWESENVAC